MANALLLGMKYVISGVLSSVLVRLYELARPVNAVWPFTFAVSVRDSGRVKESSIMWIIPPS